MGVSVVAVGLGGALRVRPGEYASAACRRAVGLGRGLGCSGPGYGGGHRRRGRGAPATRGAAAGPGEATSRRGGQSGCSPVAGPGGRGRRAEPDVTAKCPGDRRGEDDGDRVARDPGPDSARGATSTGATAAAVTRGRRRSAWKAKVRRQG